LDGGSVSVESNGRSLVFEGLVILELSEGDLPRTASSSRNGEDIDFVINGAVNLNRLNLRNGVDSIGVQVINGESNINVISTSPVGVVNFHVVKGTLSEGDTVGNSLSASIDSPWESEGSPRAPGNLSKIGGGQVSGKVKFVLTVTGDEELVASSGRGNEETREL